jgi:peptidoglycan/xylan/chitin deacetylase (PgdA/CDA1 family)
LPHKPVLLTFDDGSAGQYTRALPLLRRHHFVATFFVMTVALDKPGWLSRAEVRALDHAGMTIAAHTWDHHPVTQYTAADWPRQLIEPRDELAGIVGHPSACSPTRTASGARRRSPTCSAGASPPPSSWPASSTPPTHAGRYADHRPLADRSGASARHPRRLLTLPPRAVVTDGHFVHVEAGMGFPPTVLRTYASDVGTGVT